MRACSLCGRESFGLYYTHQLRPDSYPTYAFCSARCMNAGTAIAKRNRGMIDKTQYEMTAIRAARRNFAEVLGELGLLAPFHDRPAGDIDRIIEACVDGFQEAMRREALSDDIPF